MRRKGLNSEVIFSLASYCSIFCLLVFLAKKNKEDIYYHARQGWVLLLGEVIFGIVAFLPIIGEVISSFGIMLCIVLSVSGIIKFFIDEKWEMPLIFDIAESVPTPFD